MRSKSYIFLLVVLVLGVISGVVYSRTTYNYGLDVKGGVRLTYQMVLTQQQRLQADTIRDTLIKILGNRATGEMGVAEATIVPKGDDQLVVELPGYTDIDKARAYIGTSAKIQFYDASNVATETHTFRPYREIENNQTANPSVDFVKTADPGAKTIKFGDKEYQQIIDGWELILEGTDLQHADASPHGTNGYEPTMHFSPEGGNKMEAWSHRVYNQREKLAAVLDGRVLSMAPVEANTILKDDVVITGTFSADWVHSLVESLNAGALPVSLSELSSEKVDPVIGNYALNNIVRAGMIAFGVIAVFLLLYYAFPGLVALIALLLYVLFTLTALKAIGATFSLAAIAGFVLSVGMAVDANILVFERFKEEMKNKKSLTTALELGFRRALPAIVDSNACTILTSFVLLTLGTGPVKGFATTLIMGVAISLFTAVAVTRSLLLFFAGSGIATNEKWYAVNRNWFGAKFEAAANTTPFRVVEKSTRWFAISLITMVASIPFFIMGGMKLNVEFRGGYEAVYPVSAQVTGAQLAASLDKAGFKGGNVQLGEGPGGVRRAYITLPPSPELDTAKDSIGVIAQAAGLTVTDRTQVSFTKIGPAIQRETIQNAIEAVIVSSGLIVIFLAFRFGMGFGGFAAGLRFGVSAIIALLHDIVVVIGTAAIVGYIEQWEVSALFLTALLTVIGFSVHDTIVIFDRIRENLRRHRDNDDFATLMDKSITQSFARSINTSATVVVTLLILVIFGTATPDLKFFVLAMMIGIISGTYSSIYNASPILYLLDRAIAKKKGPEFSLVGMVKSDLAKSRTIHTAAEVPAVVNTETGRSYGQVKRRANAPKNRGHVEMDDDE